MTGNQSEEGVFDRLVKQRDTAGKRLEDRLRREAFAFRDEIAGEEARIAQLAEWLRNHSRH